MRAGFTLLELVVVLAILGMAAALVAPSMLRGIDAWQRQAQIDALLEQIRALPGDARASGRPIEITSQSIVGSAAPLRVAPDWTLQVETPWKVNANGVCGQGKLAIGNAYGVREIAVVAPFCSPELLP